MKGKMPCAEVLEIHVQILYQCIYTVSVYLHGDSNDSILVMIVIIIIKIGIPLIVIPLSSGGQAQQTSVFQKVQAP